MVSRRNVVIGVGGLVAGGGALIGTGAFDAVEAERDMTVEVADDADAFLALEAANSENAEQFVDADDGTIGIEITDTEADGQGVNRNAATAFDDLFTITNQGTDEVYVIIRDDTPTTANNAFYAQLDGERINFQASSDGTSQRSSGTWLDSTLATVVKIPVGESVTVGLEQDEPNTGDDVEDENFAVVAATDLEDIDAQTGIDADGPFGAGHGQDLKDLDGNRIDP